VNNGQSCLLEPCAQGREDIVEALLEAGENPNRPGEDGATPLLVAKQKGNAGLVSVLEEYGADAKIAEILLGQGHKGKGSTTGPEKEKANPPKKMSKSGPFGQPVNQTWSHADVAQQNGRITGVRVWAGMRVDSLQVKYGDSWSPRYGADGGNLKEFGVSSDEKIVGVMIKSGSRINAIGFILNNGKRMGPYGGGGGADSTSQPDADLAYISGSADGQPCQGLNSLTFHWN